MSVATRTDAPDPDAAPWADWLAGWDAQQQGYLPDREDRFTCMLDVLEAVGTSDPVVLDLAAGPGAVSQRVLTRFPGARTVAVDYDPVLITLGRGALAHLSDRITWVEADLRTTGWRDLLPVDRVDAVLSTTALHWLTPDELDQLYRLLHDLLVPGGVFLNGDTLRFGDDRPRLAELTTRVRKAYQHRYATGQEARPEEWQEWWERMRADGSGLLPFEERARRFPAKEHGHSETLDLATHERALRAARFAEIGTVWQHGTDRVLAAIR